ncbi:hypothetical protein ACYZT2_16180 [Pseudomonas sp. MDT1-85]
MSAVFKNKIYQSSVTAIKEQQLRSESDATERELVLRELKSALDKYSGGQSINWYGYELELQVGSSLSEVYVPGSVLFNDLLRTSPVSSAIVQSGIRDHDGLIRITHSGKLEVYGDSGWIDLVAAGYFQYSESTRYSLAVLTDIAKEAGGFIWLDNNVTLDQWLKFHDLKAPENATQTKNLIGYFEFDPAVDELGNYWGQLDTDDLLLVALSAEQCAAIRQVTAQSLSPGNKLLDTLYRKTKGGAVTQDNTAERIVELVNHSFSQAFAKKYLEKLDWFGAKPEQVVAAQDIGQLLITAILLDLEPSIGSTQRRKSVGGFGLYAPSNVERPSSVVLEELQAFLRAKQSVDFALAPLATHLLLAGIAPEFLVKGIPSSLTMGSVGWVSFCHGVALVETVRKGAARVMTYAQIMAYAELEPLSEAQARLRDLAMIDPVVDWALLNGIVTTMELTQAEMQTTERAITAFQGYTENFTQVARALPDRRNIAREALEDAAPLCDFLEEKTLHQRPGLYASPTAMSMVDLHMSGDLVGGEWDRRGVFPDKHISNTPNLHAAVTGYKVPNQHDPSAVSIHEEFQRLRRLRPNNNEFHRQLRDYLVNLNSSLVANVRLALSNMFPDDLEAFLKGKVTFFTVRSSALETSSSRLGGPLTFERDYETQQGKDAAKGRFGIVMCVSHGSTVTCYELFTLRGELRKNNALGALITQNGKFNAPARMDFNGDLKAQSLPMPLEALRISFGEYALGVLADTYADTGLAIIEKMGELPAAAEPTKVERSIYKNFSNPQLVRMAEFIVNNHPIITLEELEQVATVPTELERERAKGEKIATYFVDLVVPFKKCIEDISSAEANRVVDGIYGCVMDAIALGGAFVGAGAKALSISAKAISVASKAARLTKLAFATSISLFNPVDGVPTALFGAGKLIHKGALRFNRQAIELLGQAKSQLGNLHGSHKSYDLIRAANSAPTGQGTWRPRGATDSALTVLAARSNFQWYALDRFGKPWGPKLSNFTFVAPVRLPRNNKTLPISYTRQFIEQSLPRARAKIDNAIQVLTRNDFTAERNAVIKILLGNNSSAAFNRFLDYLRLVRADVAGVSMSNFVLDPFKDTDNIAAFNADAYNRWKGATGQSDTPFIEIYTPNLNRHFVGLGFNHDVVADDLIHELFHGSAQTNDVGYAHDAGGDAGSGQLLDVAALLNLASGRLPVTDEGTACHPGAKAFENADSLAVATSLLSQLRTDKGTYENNMTSLRAALDASGDDAIIEPVLITLNTLVVDAPRPGAHVQ